MLSVPSPLRGTLRSVGLEPPILVEFQYNPTQVSDKRAVNYATIAAAGQLLPERQYTQGGDRTISFSIHIDGLFRPADNEIGSSGAPQPLLGGRSGAARIQRDETGSIEPELNKYRAFLYPQPAGGVSWTQARSSFVPLYDATKPAMDFGSPPVCLLTMGDREAINCIATDIGINETLFNPQLRPLRADVSVTLVEYVPYKRVGP